MTTDLFPELVDWIRAGKVAATVYQRPLNQGRLALQALYQFLLHGTRPPSRLRAVPYLVMRSNLDLLLERLPVDLETVPTASDRRAAGAPHGGTAEPRPRRRAATRRRRVSTRCRPRRSRPPARGRAVDAAVSAACSSPQDVAMRATLYERGGSLNVMLEPAWRRLRAAGAPPAAAARTC